MACAFRLYSRIPDRTVFWTGLSGKHRSKPEDERVKPGGKHVGTSTPHHSSRGFEASGAGLLGTQLPSY